MIGGCSYLLESRYAATQLTRPRNPQLTLSAWRLGVAEAAPSPAQQPQGWLGGFCAERNAGVVGSLLECPLPLCGVRSSEPAIQDSKFKEGRLVF